MSRTASLGLFLTVLVLCFSGPSVRAEEKVYIDLTTQHQTMDGTAGNIYSAALGYHENVMKLITSDLNLTHVLVRTWLVDGNGENGWEPQNDDGDSSNINWPAFKDGGDVHTDFMMMKELSKAGIKPALAVFDVPDWMVSNPNAYTYRHIPDHMYPEYAEFIVSFLLHAKSEYDVNIKIVEIQNEPNIGWRVYYSPEELADITEVLLDKLDAYGLDHVKLHVGNVNKPTAAIAYWEASLERPAIAARAAAVSYHAWEDMTKPVVETLKVFCHEHDVQCWATEVGYGALGSHTWDYGAGSMRRHYEAFTWSDASMTFQWTLAGAEGSISPGGTPYPVYHLIKHFYQHIKKGSIRVDTKDDSGTLTTAFLNKSDRTLSIITINETYARNGKFIITAPNKEFSKFTVYKTDQFGVLYQNVGKVSISNGAFNYALDPNAYYTFVGSYAKTYTKTKPTHLKADMDPSAPGVEPLPTWQAHITCLASEMQWGSTGEWMPTRLHYEHEPTGQVLPAYDNFNLYPMATDCILFNHEHSDPPELTFWGATAYPNFIERPPVFDEQIPDDDETRALVLVNGDNFHVKALTKGIRPPYGSQPDIPTILSYYLDKHGIVKLPLNEMLILFELADDSSQAQEAFDFQDLVINVRAEYEVVKEIVAKNQIGPGGAFANGLAGQKAFFEPAGTEFSLPASVFTAGKNGKVGALTLIAHAIDQTNGSACDPSFWSNASYQIHFWASENAYFADPDKGDYNTTFALPTNPDYLTVVGHYTSPQDLYTQHRIEFDVSSLHWPVKAGQKFVIGINGNHSLCNMVVTFSTGHGFGSEIDVLAYDLGSGITGGPDYLPNLGIPHEQWATKVTIRLD